MQSHFKGTKIEIKPHNFERLIWPILKKEKCKQLNLFPHETYFQKTTRIGFTNPSTRYERWMPRLEHQNGIHLKPTFTWHCRALNAVKCSLAVSSPSIEQNLFWQCWDSGNVICTLKRSVKLPDIRDFPDLVRDPDCEARTHQQAGHHPLHSSLPADRQPESNKKKSSQKSPLRTGWTLQQPDFS